MVFSGVVKVPGDREAASAPDGRFRAPSVPIESERRLYSFIYSFI